MTAKSSESTRNVGVVVVLAIAVLVLLWARPGSSLSVSPATYAGNVVNFVVTGTPGHTVEQYFEEATPTPTSGFVADATYVVGPGGTTTAGFSIPLNVIGQTYPVTYSGSVYYSDTVTGAKSPTASWSITVDCQPSGCTFSRTYGIGIAAYDYVLADPPVTPVAPSDSAFPVTGQTAAGSFTLS